MKSIYLLPALSLILLAPSSGNAGDSMLRISCEDDGVGAEVLVNDKFRGECPIDIAVPEGTLKLLVRKKVDAQHERVFEQEIRMGEGSVKKVEASLGAAKLNADEAARLQEYKQRLYKMPLDALQKEAETGNAEAMSTLSDVYRDGREDLPENKELAFTWLKKAAEAGNTDAMLMVALYLSTGRAAIPQDDVEANIWYAKAAKAGNVSAMYHLAESYDDGTGLPENKAESFRWFLRAAEQGDTYSMFRVGAKYEFGLGVAPSEEQAIYWYRKAAEGKDPDSLAVEKLKKRGLL
jgi:TPR repeat protein